MNEGIWKEGGNRDAEKLNRSLRVYTLNIDLKQRTCSFYTIIIGNRKEVSGGKNGAYGVPERSREVV